MLLKKVKIVYTILQVVFLLLGNNLRAQIYGCTDPVATNYNPSATHNDGSCTYSVSTVAPVSSFSLATSISETSGLIHWNDRLWTHNDNTDVNVYSLDTLGNTVQTYSLSGTANTDWEEIAHDTDYVYLGDFGNNANGNRTDLKIFRIEKTSILLNSPVVDTIRFSYSDQSDFSPTGANNTDFDCEAFIVTQDSIFLFTKQWVSNKTSLYALSKKPGSHISKLRSAFDVQGLITGAVYLESKRLIVLSGYSNFLQPFVYLLYDFKGADYFGGNKRKISVSLPFHQVEGIVTDNGLKYYISNESISQPPLIIPQKLHTLDLSSFLNNYINGITGISEKENENSFLIFPDPAGNAIHIRCNAALVGAIYTIYDQAGKAVLTGELIAENTSVRLSNLSAGSYIFNANGVAKKFLKAVED